MSIGGDIALGSGNITTTGKLLYGNNYASTGDLPGASTYDGMFATVSQQVLHTILPLETGQSYSHLQHYPALH